MTEHRRCSNGQNVNISESHIKYKAFKSTLSLQLVPAESALECPPVTTWNPRRLPVALTHNHNVYYVKLILDNIHFLYSKSQLQMSKILLLHNFVVLMKVALLFLCYLLMLGLPFECLTPGALNIQSWHRDNVGGQAWHWAHKSKPVYKLRGGIHFTRAAVWRFLPAAKKEIMMLSSHMTVLLQ